MRFGSASLALTCLLVTEFARAQVNLPPPPPPPLGSEPPPTPPSGGSSGGSSTRRPRPAPSPPPSRPDSHPAPAPEPEEHEAPPARRGGREISLRGNPLALFVARLSVDAEWMIVPHHAVVLSPHLTLVQDRGSLAANAVGFAGASASGFGVELGYHYWMAPEPEGVFLGPSLLIDSTRPGPNASRFTAYGAAFDVGYQAVLGSGFTLAAGGGLMLITTSGSPVKLAPRVLLGVGWTF